MDVQARGASYPNKMESNDDNNVTYTYIYMCYIYVIAKAMVSITFNGPLSPLSRAWRRFAFGWDKGPLHLDHSVTANWSQPVHCYEMCFHSYIYICMYVCYIYMLYICYII